uniref:Uncharacterized protein n=1 Tax=viral metagenome TaxID=1070528 RepID=A0A6C0KB28_9ZZZZ
MEEVTEANPKHKTIIKELGDMLTEMGLPSFKWPGGQPIHMNNENVVDVLSKQQVRSANGRIASKFRYTMTLKEDGVRYLMFSGPLQSQRQGDKSKVYRRPYFLGRDMKIFQLISPDVLLASSARIVLDGEILNYRSDRLNPVKVNYSKGTSQKIEHVFFSIFDCLKNGKTDLNSPYIERFASAGESLKLLTYIHKNSPFTMFVPKRFDISVIGKMDLSNDGIYKMLQTQVENNFPKIKPFKGDYSYRPIPYDGIIFTPLYERYVSGPWKSCKNIVYKWKPTQEATVDLWAVPGKDKKIDYFTKGGNKPLDFITKVQSFSNGKWTTKSSPVLNSKDQPFELNDAAMVELMYHRTSKKKQFKFKNFRDDKNEQLLANSIQTVQRVMNEAVKIDFIGKWVKNQKNVQRELLNLLDETKLRSFIRSKVGYILQDDIGKLSKSFVTKPKTFVKITFPNDNANEVLKCLGAMYGQTAMYVTEGLISTEGGEYDKIHDHLYVPMPLPSDTETITLAGRVGIDVIKYNPPSTNKVFKPDFSYIKIIFATPYSEITIKKTRNLNDRKQSVSHEIYTEYNTSKSSTTALKFINEFLRFIDELEEKPTFSKKAKPTAAKKPKSTAIKKRTLSSEKIAKLKEKMDKATSNVVKKQYLEMIHNAKKKQRANRAKE